MKKTLIFAAIAAALLCGCNKDEPANTVTFDGKTYVNVEAKYMIQNGHGFWLTMDLKENGIKGSGLVDTPFAFGEDLKGKTITIVDSETGYGDRLIMSFYSGDNSYNYIATPVSGTQTTKKIDDSHYSIKMDTKDDKGKVFQMDILATLEVAK